MLKVKLNVRSTILYCVYEPVWASESRCSGVTSWGWMIVCDRWAVSSVMTRQNQIPTEDGSRVTLALIPLWDMCNHTNGLVMPTSHTQTHTHTITKMILTSIWRNESLMILRWSETSQTTLRENIIFMHAVLVFSLLSHKIFIPLHFLNTWC